MTVDFGSEVLDALFALAFVYFLLSLIVSAGTEAISWFLQKRAKNLEEGMRKLLEAGDDEEELAGKVLDQPLVKGMVKDRKFHLPQAKLPSYVSPRNFALALVSLVEKPDEALGEALGALPDPLEKQLKPMAAAVGDDIDKFRESVEHWYDDAMERVSGWYKRWALGVTVALAVVVTIGFNVSTIRVADRLFNDEAVRNSVVAAGENTLKEQTQQKAGEGSEEAVETLTALKLPIGWDAANAHFNLALLAGWLLTVAAISLGSPFWFGALSRLASLRAAGGKPQKPEDGSS